MLSTGHAWRLNCGMPHLLNEKHEPRLTLLLNCIYLFTYLCIFRLSCCSSSGLEHVAVLPSLPPKCSSEKPPHPASNSSFLLLFQGCPVHLFLFGNSFNHSSTFLVFPTSCQSLSLSLSIQPVSSSMLLMPQGPANPLTMF